MNKYYESKVSLTKTFLFEICYRKTVAAQLRQSFLCENTFTLIVQTNLREGLYFFFGTVAHRIYPQSTFWSRFTSHLKFS